MKGGLTISSFTAERVARRPGAESKQRSSRDVLGPYLTWMIDRHQTLELRGIRSHGRISVPLEKVYVALKGDRTHPFERAQARLALERELEAIIESGEYSIEDIHEARWYLVAGSSVMPSLETRDRPFILPNDPVETLTLGEAYRQHRRLVILGDPGSGKTTLARWLALVMAQAMKNGKEIIEVPLHQVNPEVRESDDSFKLGQAKLPVLVRVAEYADDRLAFKSQGKVPRTLTEYLGHHTWLNSVPTYEGEVAGRGDRIEPELPNTFIREYLEKGEALIILDGLDEVPASVERDEILAEVHAFLGKSMVENRVALSREGDQIVGTIIVDDTATRRGNQLIVTSRTGVSPDAPHIWAPLVLAAMVKDVEQSLRQAQENEYLWVRLGESPDQQQVDALRRLALTGGLILTRMVAQILDDVIQESGRANMVTSLFPFLERPEPESLPIIEQWLDSQNATIARYASLFVAEVQGISERTAPVILEFLHDRHDLSRHRAARLIHHPAINPNEPTRSISSMGRETIHLLMREMNHRRFEAPRVSLVIMWMCHDLIYDDAEMFDGWVKSLNDNDDDAAIAKDMLASIEALTSPVREAFCAALIHGKAEVKIALLTSICRLLYKQRVEKGKVIKRISHDQWADLLSIIPRMDLADLSEVKILKAGPLDFVEAARQALRTQPETSGKEAIRLAEQLLKERYTTSFADLLRFDPDAMKEEMKKIAAHNIYAPDIHVRRAVQEADEKLKEDPDLFKLVLHWLMDILQESAQDPRFDQRRYYLLLIVAASAELSPATFANIVAPEEMEPLLISTTKYHNAYPGRAAAVTMLGFLRRVTSKVIEALHSAMQDFTDVQQGALNAVLRFRRLDGDILPLLLGGLYHDSAMASYATAQLLTALGRSDRANPEQRRQILQALADAKRDIRSQRVVHFGYVDARVPALPRLDHEFHKALMQIAGLI